MEDLRRQSEVARALMEHQERALGGGIKTSGPDPKTELKDEDVVKDLPGARSAGSAVSRSVPGSDYLQLMPQLAGPAASNDESRLVSGMDVVAGDQQPMTHQQQE